MKGHKNHCLDKFQHSAEVLPKGLRGRFMISRHGWDILGVCYIKRTVGIRRQLFGCVLGMPGPCEHAGAIQVRNVLPCIADVTAQRCCMELMHIVGDV